MIKKLNQGKSSYFDFKKLTSLDPFNLSSLKEMIRKKVVKSYCCKVRSCAQN